MRTELTERTEVGLNAAAERPEDKPKRKVDVLGAVEHPVLRADGSVLSPGYDEETQLYFRPAGLVMPSIPDRPTEDDVAGARERLLDLVADFPFASAVDRSAWLASLLTFFCRDAYSSGGTPFFLVDANTRGTGTSLLADLTAIIPTGRRMPVHCQPAGSREMRGLIRSTCIAGRSVVCLEHTARPFGYSELDSALSSSVWSESSTGPAGPSILRHRCIWFGTGVNVQFKANSDTSRRTLRIRLSALEEYPENRRGFRHSDLLGYARGIRGLLICDCLTLLRAGYLNRSLRPSMSCWPLFEHWSEWVRGAVVNAGLPDPRGN